MSYRNPYVGQGADGARQSTQIDRGEADTLEMQDPRRARLLESAARWEDQAETIERERTAPQQPAPGWPQQQPTVRAWSDPKPPKPPFYRRGWFPLVTFLVGAIIGAGTGDDIEPQTRTRTVTVTSIVEREAPGPTVTQAPSAPSSGVLSDGIYEVGAEIKPGTYKTSGDFGCYYARLRSDNTNDIIANNVTEGPQTIRVRATDSFVEFSGGCEWRRSG